MNTPSRMEATTLVEDLTTSKYWNDEWCTANDAARPQRRRVRRHPLPPIISRLLQARGPEPIDILEVGCAPGSILSQLATLRPRDRYHGIDFSEPGLEQAKRFLASRDVRAMLHYGDVREFEPDQKYGLVYSCGLIEHFTDPTAIVKHHARLCTPGGFVVASVPNYRGRLQQWFINQLDPGALESHNLQIMTVEALRQIFGDAGLRDVVAGCDGPPLIRSQAVRRSLRARFLRRLAQTWNLANTHGPRLSPRRSVLWAYGRAA